MGGAPHAEWDRWNHSWTHAPYDTEARPTTWEEVLKADPKMKLQIGAATRRSSALLGSPNFHSVNLVSAKQEDVKKLVAHLVRLDRLPAENPREGLELMQQLWDEHDVRYPNRKLLRHALLRCAALQAPCC